MKMMSAIENKIYEFRGLRVMLDYDLADHLELPLPQIQSVATLWEAAKCGLGAQADHTEIHRHLQALAASGPRG
mgnify:CR=1 FL=1